MNANAAQEGGNNIRRKVTATLIGQTLNDPDSPRQQIKREMRELESEKQLPLPIPPAELLTGERRNTRTSNSSKEIEHLRRQTARQRKRELIRRTLSEDYPGLDYLGFHNVLNARFHWYRILWFSILSICLLLGLFTIYRIVREYSDNPTATLINVKSVEKLLLPQLTVCPTNAATVNLGRLEQDLFANNPRIGGYTQEDVLNFAYFLLAGSGFQKLGWKKFDEPTRERMNHFYDIFRQEQSTEQFFHFFFDNFGLDCHQLFQECQLGEQKLDCCQVFEPVYLIRRGRCFRSLPMEQQNFDELGKLRVQLMHPEQMDANMTTQEEIIAFIAEHKPQIAPFPRFYLYPNVWTKMRLTAKRIRLFPAEEVCSDEFSGTGKDFCYIQKWLHTFLEEPLNCTYPYMNTIRPTELKSCEPLTILENYATSVEATNYSMQSCILPCNRWEYTVSMEKIDTASVYKNVSRLPFIYRIDLSYNDLQFELIEEVTTLTFAGLIAQIGGQMSLFMGSSILTLIQALIMAVIICHRMLRAKQKEQSAVGDVENQQRREGGQMPPSADEANGRQGDWRDGGQRGKGGGIPLAQMDSKFASAGAKYSMSSFPAGGDERRIGL